MSKRGKIPNKKFNEIIKICQNALKGKIKPEDADLLHFLPDLRAEIQKGKFEFASIKAFSLSSQVLDLKTRNLLLDFLQNGSDSDIDSLDKFTDMVAVESAFLYPINSFRDYIIENDIVKSYFELLINKKIKHDYSASEKKEIRVQEENEFEEVDSFEQDKLKLFLKLTKLNKKVIDFNTLQANFHEQRCG